MYNRKIPSLPRSSHMENEKHIVPLVAAAIIAGGSALVQSGVNYANQAKANRTNKKLTRETNELNYKMFKEQMEYEKEQADLEFERNKEQQAYATQVGLMRQAGLNPAVMYGQGSVSQPAQYQRASSVSRPTMEAAQVQPETFDFTTPVQQAVSAAAQFENDIAQAPVNVGVKKSNILANNSSAQEMQVRARAEQFNLDMDKLFTGMERTVELNKAINDFKNSVADWQLKLLQGKNITADTINKYADTFLKHMQTQLTEQQYDSLKQQLPQILANLKATGENIKAQTNNINVQTDWLPFNAQTARISANASSVAAAAQDYLAQHPNDFQGFLVKALQGAFGSADEFGKYIANKFGINSSVISSGPKNDVEANAYNKFLHELFGNKAGKYVKQKDGSYKKIYSVKDLKTYW